MSESSVIVVQRQTLDWSSMTPERFRPLSADFCRIWSKPEDYVFRLMQLWDKTFSCGYFETRARLKQISTDNLCALQHVQFVPFDAYRNIPDQKGFYVFMDDDDWAAPSLGQVLQQQSPDACSALLWRAVNVGSPQQEHPVFVWGMNGRCMTNNYAVSSAWLQHLQRLPDVVQHWGAAQTLMGVADIVQLDEALTASNKSPCSSVSLDRGLQGQLEPERLAQLVEEYLVKMRSVEETHLWKSPWVRPLIEQVVALFKQVSDSRCR